METKFVVGDRIVDYEQAKTLLANKPLWIVFNLENSKLALSAADLAYFLENAPVEILSLEKKIDLTDIPGRRITLQPIHDTASLHEALLVLSKHEIDALYVSRAHSPIRSDVRGIVTLDAIENYYQPREFRHAVE